ncbi:MAG: GGDEF domain-containing protein, partial [Burkholderiales bacterium]
MPIDIASLLLALMINQITMAVALPAVMGQVSRPARLAQFVVLLQASGWALLLGSGLADAGGGLDRAMSAASMACLAGSLAMLARAFDLWCGRNSHDRVLPLIALVLPLGYVLGFSSYPFRVGWANGLLALQMLMVAASLARTPPLPVGRWRWLVVVSLLAQALVTAWRGVLGAVFTEAYPTFLAPHPVNYASAVVVNATSLLSLIGILLAHRDEAARGLERLAMLDGLTGVFNRRAWLARAGDELAISVRYDQPLAVLMIDLDHFKQINDTRGHEAGDRALQLVAGALQAAVRTGDLVGRYGGEEFCVLMNHADHAAARAFDRRLRARLAESSARELGFALDYSAGIAMRTAPDDTLEAMLRRADTTLYRAKAEGRARTLDEMGLRLQA